MNVCKHRLIVLEVFMIRIFITSEVLTVPLRYYQSSKTWQKFGDHISTLKLVGCVSSGKLSFTKLV